MTSLAWVAGRVVPLADARIALSDPGFLLGDGVFESLYVRGGEALHWELHRQRLQQGMATVGIAADAIHQADEALAGLLAGGSAQGMALRLQVSRQATGAGEVSALLKPLPRYPEVLYRHGARLLLAAQRRDPRDPLHAVKSLSFQAATLRRRHAQQQGFDDALIGNLQGNIAEASYANVIARCGEVVHAPGPAEGALAGVTRRILLQALPNGYRVETCLPVHELAQADEVMLTSTYAGVVPVQSIDVPGKRYHYALENGMLTRLLSQHYKVLLAALGE